MNIIYDIITLENKKYNDASITDLMKHRIEMFVTAIKKENLVDEVEKFKGHYFNVNRIYNDNIKFNFDSNLEFSLERRLIDIWEKM